MYYRQLQQSEQLKPVLSLYIQDTFQKGESQTTPENDGGPALETELVNSISLLVEKQHEKTTPRETACCGRRKVDALEVKVWIETRPREKARIQRTRKGFSVQLFAKELLG